MRYLLIVLFMNAVGLTSAQVIHGGAGRFVAMQPTLDSTITLSSALDADEILIAITTDSLCSIQNARIARDIADGCGNSALLRARSMEQEIMKYYGFKCPEEIFVRCRCTFDD
ncbi:MAG: hypothetical protein MUE88_04190 [Flavobacteriales bacterium]|jgi:hypothetical protein|nr:hypothetical protein [Flavobacteriales bacterium]